MSAPEPRKPSLLPALFALVLIAALAAFVWLRRGEPRSAPPAAAPAATAPAAAPSLPPVATAPAAAAPARPAPTSAAAPLRPADEPQLSREQPPEPKAKKPKLTLDEKLALTQPLIDEMQTRAELLQREVDALEASGKRVQALQKRILVTRLKAHAERLRAAIAEHREPE